MKGKRFKEEQIIRILQKAERGKTAAEELGIDARQAPCFSMIKSSVKYRSVVCWDKHLF